MQRILVEQYQLTLRSKPVLPKSLENRRHDYRTFRKGISTGERTEGIQADVNPNPTLACVHFWTLLVKR